MTALGARRMIASSFCTKKPRQEWLVEPHTAACTWPSTTTVLLCWRLPRCCRLTWSAPADTASRAAAAVSADVASPWAPSSSMRIFSRVPSFSRRETMPGSFRSYTTARTSAVSSAIA